MVLEHTQYLCFEVSEGCNLAQKHSPKCPVVDRGRWLNQYADTPMPGEDIVEVASRAYRDFGFKGLIGWHYYNEPTMAWGRMMALMDSISECTPKAGYTLWTHGGLLNPHNHSAGLSLFSQVHITNYLDKDWSWVEALVPKLIIHSPTLDDRATAKEPPNERPCYKLYNELVFDYYGNAHPCFMDWRGEIRLGNIQIDAIETILGRYERLRRRVGPLQLPGAPLSDKCKTCPGRGAGIEDLVPEVARRIRRDLRRD